MGGETTEVKKGRSWGWKKGGERGESASFKRNEKGKNEERVRR